MQTSKRLKLSCLTIYVSSDKLRSNDTSNPINVKIVNFYFIQCFPLYVYAYYVLY